MTEILTESFCERCGTRYTFETVAGRQHRLGGLRVLGKGLKHFVLSDDSSLDEAMAAARADEDREVTSQQLDAFHRTFNFCISCRQYTCANCWNLAEARCLSCAPLAFDAAGPFAAAPADGQLAAHVHEHPAVADLAATAWPASDLEVEAESPAGPFDGRLFLPPPPPTGPFAAPEPDEPVRADQPDLVAEAGAQAPWPAEPLAAEPLAAEVPAVEIPAPGLPFASPFALEPEEAPTPIQAAAAPVEVEQEAEAPEVAAQLASAQPLPEEPAAEAPATTPAPTEEVPTDTASTARRAAARTSALLGRFRPGQSLDAEIAAFEAAQSIASSSPLAPEAPAELVTAEAAAFTTEPVTAGAAPVDSIEELAGAPATTQGAEPAVIPAAEPSLLEPAAATPAAPATEPHPLEPAAAGGMSPDPTTPGQDVIPQPTWPRVTPPPADQEPQWPTGPRWPTAVPARAAAPEPEPAVDQLAFILSRKAGEAIWAESTRDLLQSNPAGTQAPSVRSCPSCGLSLSATARFCRRCGTRQEG
jgi:ribosomal protein L40E